MGVAYNSSKVVTDGLLCLLDPANPKSYPGTGTSWFDLSPYKRTAYLNAGPVFNTDNMGTFYFDGVNDTATISIPEIVGWREVTVEMWLKWRGGSNKMFWGNGTYDVYTYGGGLGYNTGLSNCMGIPSSVVSPYVNKFTHYAFVIRTGVAISNNKIYINSVDQGPLSALVGPDSVAPNFVATTYFSHWGGSGAYFIDASFGKVAMYDRELSAEEIRQNYMSTKSRYGL